MTQATQTVGFIGLGQMGRPMVENLGRAGFPVLAFDLDARALAEAATLPKVSAAESAAELAKRAATVVLMLPDSRIVDRLLWDDGFAARLARGTLLIDMGSSNPMNTRENARRLASLGVALVDAPVSGGVKRAVSASLAIMIGGEAEPVARAMPVLSALGKTLIHVGGSGSGHAIKALNNYVSAAGLAAVCEALDAAQRFGIDPSVANRVFDASTGKNNTTENKVEAFMLSGRFDSGFALALMRKDLQTALSLMDGVDASKGLAERCVQLWEGADQALGKGADHTAFYRYAREGEQPAG